MFPLESWTTVSTVVIFAEKQLDPVISGGGEIGLFIMGNHHPRYHVLQQGIREGIRIRHIKENAGVTQNHPHAGRFRQNGAFGKQLLFARVFLIDQHQNFLKEKRGSGSGFYRSLRRSEDLLCRLRHCGAVFGRNGKVIDEKSVLVPIQQKGEFLSLRPAVDHLGGEYQ